MNRLIAWLKEDEGWNIPIFLFLIPIAVYGLGFLILPILGQFGIVTGYVSSGM